MSSPEMQRPPLRKYCLQCEYMLDGLREHRCPECGHPFDPDDQRTFKTARRHRFWRWHMVLRPSPLSYLYFLVPAIAALVALLLLSLLR